MADIGQVGLEMAAAVVERVLAVSRGEGELRVPVFGPDGGPAPDRNFRRLRVDAERLIDMYAEWMRTVVLGVIDLVEQRGVQDGNRHDELLLGPVAQCHQASAKAWLHLLDGPAAGIATLRATDLTCHDGSIVASSCISFEPPVFDTAALRTSQEVCVGVHVPPGTAPGVYHGHVLLGGLAEVWLGLRVEVQEPDAP
jgi:hypothetical protein